MRISPQLHSCQDMLSTQLQNAVIELLSQFIANDFSEIDKLKENYESAWQGEYMCVSVWVWDCGSNGLFKH